jgi:DNA repair protein RecN (Recombination protein N)
VICITHLPQVASLGDQHFLVAKKVEKGRTATALRALAQEERLTEIARMLGGKEITATVRKHAQEMLRR